MLEWTVCMRRLTAHFFAVSHQHIDLNLYAITLSSTAVRTSYLFYLYFIRVFQDGTSVSVITQLQWYCQLSPRCTRHSHCPSMGKRMNFVAGPVCLTFESVHVCFLQFSVSDWPCHAYCRCSMCNTFCKESEISLPCFSLYIAVETEFQLNQRCGSGRRL